MRTNTLIKNIFSWCCQYCYWFICVPKNKIYFYNDMSLYISY